MRFASWIFDRLNKFVDKRLSDDVANQFSRREHAINRSGRAAVN
jgi:hypothetical protein